MKRIRIPLAALVTAAIAALAIGASTSPASSSDAQQNIVQTAIAAGKFKTLASLLTKAGLVDTLSTGGPYTVFAPTDAAFAKVPKATLAALAQNKAKLRAVLLYHVVSGNVMAADAMKLSSAETLNGSLIGLKVKKGSLYVNQARVTGADVMASNGVIHVVNRVLIPPKNIVKTAAEAGKFKTLVALLKKTGLARTLQSKGPFTVFAPTDAAFAKVPKATLAALAQNKAKLRAVLLYHVVSGNVMAADAMKLSSAKTLNGASLRLKLAKGRLYVNQARVTGADVMASNGVIHVVNRVLIP